jgi:hypothetical protein
MGRKQTVYENQWDRYVRAGSVQHGKTENYDQQQERPAGKAKQQFGYILKS